MSDFHLRIEFTPGGRTSVFALARGTSVLRRDIRSVESAAMKVERYPLHEHACVALAPSHVRVAEEVASLRRNISNMVIPKPNLLNSMHPTMAPPPPPLADLATCHELCDQFLEANAQSPKNLGGKSTMASPGGL